MPWANLARISAVAGATTNASIGLSDGNVLNGRFDVGLRFVRAEQVGNDFFAGERCEGERTNELLRGAGHHDLHAKAAILQQADDLRRLVGRDPTGDTQGDFHANPRVHQRVFI